MMSALALLCCIILGSLAIFQLALVLGAPLGKYAWGGSYTVLPTGYRIGSVISVVLYACIASILLEKAEVIAVYNNPAITNTGARVIAGYFSLGILLNGISRSKPERYLMTPIVALLAAVSILIALS